MERKEEASRPTGLNEATSTGEDFDASRTRTLTGPPPCWAVLDGVASRAWAAGRALKSNSSRVFRSCIDFDPPICFLVIAGWRASFEEDREKISVYFYGVRSLLEGNEVSTHVSLWLPFNLIEFHLRAVPVGVVPVRSIVVLFRRQADLDKTGAAKR
jgi:hypothetical protein